MSWKLKLKKNTTIKDIIEILNEINLFVHNEELADKLLKNPHLELTLTK